MIFHIGIVGDQNSYHCFTDLAEAETFISRVLGIWQSLGFAVEQPLFNDAPREWIGYDGLHVVRQMLLVTEEVNNDGTTV